MIEQAANCEYPAGSVDQNSTMSEEYRTTLLRVLANQAYGEQKAAETYAKWIIRAPSTEARKSIRDIVTEEVSHWSKVVALMEELGVSEDQVRNHQSFQYHYSLSRLFVPRFRWVDVILSALLLDRAGYFMIEDYSESSYAPFMQVARDILEDEDEHSQAGQDFLGAQIDEIGRATTQRSLNKWWRIVLNSFGPPVSRHHDTYTRLGLKHRSNEDRRQIFIADMTPRLEALGLHTPSLVYRNYPIF